MTFTLLTPIHQSQLGPMEIEAPQPFHTVILTYDDYYKLEHAIEEEKNGTQFPQIKPKLNAAMLEFNDLLDISGEIPPVNPLPSGAAALIPRIYSYIEALRRDPNTQPSTATVSGMTLTLSRV